MPEKQTFDAIVVGSGASGGWACKRLSEAGVNVALLDAGRPHDETDFREHQPVFDLKYRNLSAEVVKRTRPIQSAGDCDEYNYDWFCNDLEEPYTTPPDKSFAWLGRLRVTGGRTNVWGRVSLRLSDLDFKAASRDGFGEDWPLSYRDLQPYYDLVESYMGVQGQKEGLPQLPDGRFQPPMKLTCAEMRMRARAHSKLGWTLTPKRTANLTQPLNGRRACHYCGPCNRGCITHSYFNSAFTTVSDAFKSGKCVHVPNALVYKVLLDSGTRRARGVLYIDRETHEAKEVYARSVVLCAQAIESVRILLNSGGTDNPQGLANSSGVLGHYLMDHTEGGGGAVGEFPDLPGPLSADGPNRPSGFYVARFRNLLTGPRSQKFLRGYGFEGSATTDFNWDAPGFGQAFKRELMVPVTAAQVSGTGECLPRIENRVEIDPNVRDAYGIPVPRITLTHSENERAMMDDMAVAAAELLEASGARNIRTWRDDPVPGSAIHELGSARMGKDPKRSVLNQFQQTHDVKNLFVMDGSGFPSSACQNPTLTIMALAVRSSDHLIATLKRRDI